MSGFGSWEIPLDGQHVIDWLSLGCTTVILAFYLTRWDSYNYGADQRIEVVLLADPAVAIVDDSGFGSVSESKVVSLVECCAFNGLRLLGNISLVQSGLIRRLNGCNKRVGPTIPFEIPGTSRLTYRRRLVVNSGGGKPESVRSVHGGRISLDREVTFFSNSRWSHVSVTYRIPVFC